MQTEAEAAFIDPKGYIDTVNAAQAEFDQDARQAPTFREG